MGLRQLKQIWQRLAKGEKAMRVEIWRQGCLIAKQVLFDDAFDLNLANPNPNALSRACSYFNSALVSITLLHITSFWSSNALWLRKEHFRAMQRAIETQMKAQSEGTTTAPVLFSVPECGQLYQPMVHRTLRLTVSLSS